MRYLALPPSALLLGCALTHHSAPPLPDAATAAVPDAAVGAWPFDEEPLDEEPLDEGSTERGDAGAVKPAEPPRPVPPEICNHRDDDQDGKLDEGCPLRLATQVLPTERRGWYETPLQLDRGRVLWLQRPEADTELWTAQLPAARPERALTLPYAPRAWLDADRLLYADAKRGGLVLRDVVSGVERVITPSVAGSISDVSLEGRYLAYAQDLPDDCDWCEDTGVFVHDLDSGATQLVTTQPNIQRAPYLSQGWLIWLDDRDGHHNDRYGLDHRFDAAATRLPVVTDDVRLLTHAPPSTQEIIAFEAGRVLLHRTATYDTPQPDALQVYTLLDVATGSALPLDWALPVGDVPLDLSAKHLLVQRDPRGRCHLEVVNLTTRRSLEIDTQGLCVSEARIDEAFVIWTRAVGATVDLYWLDFGDLDAAQ